MADVASSYVLHEDLAFAILELILQENRNSNRFIL